MDFLTGEIIAIDKPYGMSSFGALARVRYLLSRRLGVKRVKTGHAGTLDPLATGVLVICTGKCTKLIPQLQDGTKEYTARLQLGATTPSFDREHTVDFTYPTAHITADALRQVLLRFTGEIDQVPPVYSACKTGGHRAYKLARRGEEPQLAPKRVTIEALDLTGFDPATMTATIHVRCSKGTYVRSLARDIGRALGSGAFLAELRRTRVGDYTADSAIDFDHLETWIDTAVGA